MRLSLISLAVAAGGFASAETLVRIAIDEEPSSHLQEAVFKVALGGLLGSIAFFAGLLLWMSRKHRRERDRADGLTYGRIRPR